jgi:hypothetical protein
MLDQEKRMSKNYHYNETIDWLDDDWGLIISNDGNLRGVYVPAGFENEPIPDSLLHICTKYFGVDPTETEDLIKQPVHHQMTLH